MFVAHTSTNFYNRQLRQLMPPSTGSVVPFRRPRRSRLPEACVYGRSGSNRW
ncbi:hypothetical protein BN903_36 [Halorubrum sp. AJ67]|nr:hypothetical protein BN903_36 [Halorubrum sp. AJ67]